MTYTAGFNAGVEAAVTTEQAYRFLECAVRNWSLVSFDQDGLEDFRIELERFRQKVLADALKRPEPSEAEKAERVAMWLFMEDQSGMMYPRKWDRLADSAREWWRIKARAALKAMEGE